MDALCTQLVEFGIPVKRVRINFRTLHPQVVAWSAIWDQQSGAQVEEISKETIATEDYLGSPIEHIYEQKTPLDSL